MGAQNQKYYIDHKEKLSLQACEKYSANSDIKCLKIFLKFIESKGWHTIATIMKPTKRRETLILMTIMTITKRKEGLFY